MEENPFSDSIIADWTFLDDPGPRNKCPRCNKSRKYYCYSCYVPLPHISSKIPKVQLPIKVDIIKHPSEIDGKSTSPHAAVLAPDDVAIHTYPCIPDYDKEKVVLVFPCNESVTLEELAEMYTCKSDAADTKAEGVTETDPFTSKTRDSDGSFVASPDSISNPNSNSVAVEENCTEGGSAASEKSQANKVKMCDSNHICQKRHFTNVAGAASDLQGEGSLAKQIKLMPTAPFDKVVFIDSTWNQTNNIMNDERLKNLRRVELRSRDTHFWRCQDGIPKSYLSTIEAIYYFMKDFHSLFLGSRSEHEYDNLLFFFCYMYNKIRNSAHGGRHLKAYKR